jgi:hypothetical protein
MRIRNPNSPRSPREDGVNRPSRGPRGPIASPVIGPRKGGKPMPQERIPNSPMPDRRAGRRPIAPPAMGPIAPPVGKGPRGPIAPPVGKGPRGPIASPVIGPRKGGKPMPPNMKKGAPMGGAIEKMPRGGAFMGRRPKR